MYDERQNPGKTSAFSQLDGTPFTSFSKPYLDFIEKGRLFLIAYTVMEIINLLLPFAIIYIAIDSGLLRNGEAKLIFAFVFSWLIIAFASWIGFQLWWNRRAKAKAKALENAEFVGIQITTELIQTFGEWLGTLIGIIGAGVGLVATITLGDYAQYLFRAIGMNFMPTGIGIAVVAAGPVIGFFIILGSRFLAEWLRQFVALVYNTKYIAINIMRAAQKPPSRTPGRR